MRALVKLTLGRALAMTLAGGGSRMRGVIAIILDGRPRGDWAFPAWG